VDILSSRVLLRPADFDRSVRFYRDVLGLAIYREFGWPASPGVVFFLGPGFLEVSGRSVGPVGRSVNDVAGGVRRSGLSMAGSRRQARVFSVVRLPSPGG
jgi:catechol 2,3-dioxygenase-like lactoylglutathione lyase family enzyme